jgi:methyl-accepting chemotaxis protein
MNRLTSGVLAIGLSAILAQATPAIGQTSTTTGAKKSADSSAETLKGYTVEKKNEAVAHGKKMMSELDGKIKALETQISKDVSAANADVKRQVNDLKASRNQTAKKLDEMGKASKESWNSAKDAFAASYSDLHKAYDDAIAKVRK